MLKLNNIYKSFKDGGSKIDVLNNLNLEIKEGEFIAITGASGSGKSTLLNIIATILKADSGEYFLNGTDVFLSTNNKKCRIRNEDIAYVFQDFAMLEDKSVFNNIVLPLRYNKRILRREWKSRVHNALPRVLITIIFSTGPQIDFQEGKNKELH